MYIVYNMVGVWDQGWDCMISVNPFACPVVPDIIKTVLWLQIM